MYDFIDKSFKIFEFFIIIIKKWRYCKCNITTIRVVKIWQRELWAQNSQENITQKRYTLCVREFINTYCATKAQNDQWGFTHKQYKLFSFANQNFNNSHIHISKKYKRLQKNFINFKNYFTHILSVSINFTLVNILNKTADLKCKNVILSQKIPNNFNDVNAKRNIVVYKAISLHEK